MDRIIRWAALAALVLLPSLAKAQGGQVTLVLSSPQPLPNCDPATQGQRQPLIWDVTAQQMKTCTAHNTWSGIGAPTLFYQTVDQGGTPATQRAALNLINGTNMTITCVDNSGAGRTDCTFAATSTAAVAFSAITPALNNTAGTYSASGNTWDFSLATALLVPKTGLSFPGGTSGTTVFAPPATGNQTINIPAAGGTLAVSALGPLNLTAGGQLQCPTCNTSTATLSSVGLTQTGSVFTITNSPLTGAGGTINIALASQAQNLFIASPSGAPGAPTPRAIVGADLPAINLAASGAGGVTGILPKTGAPASDVYTDQSNTYSTGTQSFAAATALITPLGAALAPTASGSLGYDTTANRYTAGANGTNVILPWFLTGTPVNGNCVTWTGTNGLLGQAACGGGGSGSVNAASQFSIPYYSGAGTASTLSGVPSPTTPGLYTVAYSISSGAAAPIISLPGINVRANTATTDTILQTDRVTLVTESNAGAINVTGPALTSNIAFATMNLSAVGTGLETFTPASGQVNAAASQIVPGKWFAFHYTDGSNAFMPVMPTLQAFPNAPTTPLFFTAATGVFSTATLGPAGGGSGLVNPTAHADLQAEGASNFNLVGAAALTGQVKTAVNGADPVYASPGVADGNSAAAVTTTPYTVQCDSASTLVDRGRTLRFRSGAAAITVPLSTASGCTSNFTTFLINDGAGTLTSSRTGADTFSVFNGGTSLDGQTSFTLTNGQYAALNQGATGIWNVRIVTQNATTVNGGAVPASAGVLGSNGSNQPIAASAHGINGPLLCTTASGSGTTYTCTTSPAFTPAVGDTINVKIDTTNTGSATLNVNATGAATVKKAGGGTNLAAADIITGQILEMFFDGANWQANCLTAPGTPNTITAVAGKKVDSFNGITGNFTASAYSLASPIFSTTDTLTDTTTGEQLFATNMTIPSGTLTANVGYKFFVTVESTGVATIPNSTFQVYLCPTQQGTLTGCKNVYKSTTGPAPSGTSSASMEFAVVGETAAGATATVMMMSGTVGANSPIGKNTVAASQGNVPTNANLYVQFTITYASAAGGGANTTSVRGLIMEPGPIL